MRWVASDIKRTDEALDAALCTSPQGGFTVPSHIMNPDIFPKRLALEPFAQEIKSTRLPPGQQYNFAVSRSEKTTSTVKK